MFFGYFFGLFEGRGQGYKNRQKEEAEERKQGPVEPLPPASPPVQSDETSLLDVSMGMDGQLRLKMDGQPADTSALDAEKRKRLIEILTHMRPWLETPKSQPAQKPAASPPPQPVASQQGAQSPKGASLSERISQAGVTAPPTTAPAPQQTPTPKPATPVPDDDNDRAAESLSIVGQINSVLQARLVGTPLADKGIRLQESLEGGVTVWVGISKFEGVDAVPDNEIKAVIRAAITEWENKYTPGL
jgi:hypothetical protein